MNQDKDISTITSLTILKSMAYDAIAAKEQAENNLRVINTRITQVQQDPSIVQPNDKKASE